MRRCWALTEISVSKTASLLYFSTFSGKQDKLNTFWLFPSGAPEGLSSTQDKMRPHSDSFPLFIPPPLFHHKCTSIRACVAGGLEARWHPAETGCCCTDQRGRSSLISHPAPPLGCGCKSRKEATHTHTPTHVQRRHWGVCARSVRQSFYSQVM